MSIVTPYENRTNTDNSHNMFPTRRRLSCYTSPSLMFSFTNTSTFFLQTRRHYLCPAHREVDPLNLPILIYPASGIHASSGGLLISRQWHTCLFWRQTLLIFRQWHGGKPYFIPPVAWRQTLFISRQWHGGKPYLYPASGMAATLIYIPPVAYMPLLAAYLYHITATPVAVSYIRHLGT